MFRALAVSSRSSCRPSFAVVLPSCHRTTNDCLSRQHGACIKKQWTNLLLHRSVWSTGQTPPETPSFSLSPNEVSKASQIVRDHLSGQPLRFMAVTYQEDVSTSTTRSAEVLVLNTFTGLARELSVDLASSKVTSSLELPPGVQPFFTPEECDLAEAIAKNSIELQTALKERYNITDMDRVAADPWSVNLASAEDVQMTMAPDGSPRRLVQTFLYQRVQGVDMEDNHYAHPIDLVPVVDLNSGTVIKIDGLDRLPPPAIPQQSVNYHRNLIKTNEYLSKDWRSNPLADLDIDQPNGPSFIVTNGNSVQWQNWSFTVGFNYREGLVLHNVCFDGRSVLKRGALVEMAVPYGDPRPPYTRKCAFDVGDYGLGNCANSLELGCDCLGHIHYFDAVLNTTEGQPKILKKAVCMHEQDNGLLWKHVEYRNRHNESRRNRELIISSIATVVNYEYCFYWKFKLDGTIEYEIRLTGELSTNLLSAGEDTPTHGTLVAPGVNSQIHQHMFCAKLDMAVDGDENTVSEIDIVPQASKYGNAFVAIETPLKTEQHAVRTCDMTRARSWKISNAQGKLNPITNKPVAYKLIPFSSGASMPTLLTADAAFVTKKGAFATANLWVTPQHPKERYPAGDYTPQQTKQDGLPVWIQKKRSIAKEKIVVWHAFGVTHVPRVEDFPVMPCEMTGFSLKPDGFTLGNPAIDLPIETKGKSTLSKGCCA